MSPRALAATVLTLGSCLFLSHVSGAAAARKPKRRAPATPAVTAAMRGASLRKVDAYLEDSVATNLLQPGALVPFFEELFLLSSGPTHDPVHILHYGDSHTAADEFTDEMRQRLQQAFGNGGSGFSLAGRPFLGYRRFDARGGGTTGWQAQGLRTGSGDGFFGLGGVSIQAQHTGQSVFLDAECDRLELHYLQQPSGGSVALYSDNTLLDRFSTEGETAAAFKTEQIDPALHRYRLVTLDSHPVRLFGWVADKVSGVTYEAFGINGAEAAVMLHWNQDMLATYLQRRNPGLIVLAYGTNEATDPSWNPASYEAMFSELLQALRRACPTASILVLGPGDRWQRSRGAWHIVNGIDDIIAAQRQAVRVNRCAFWDTRERMGGKGSMRDWVYSGLAQNDHVHFTVAGYRRLAAALFEDINRQYEVFKSTRLEAGH